jgi:phage recombination protein Bet
MNEGEGWPIDRLGLKTRALNALKANDIRDVATLCAHTRRELRKMAQLSDTGIAEIIAALAEHGLGLREPDDMLDTSKPASTIARHEPRRYALINFSDEQLALIKRTVAEGASNDELELFLYQCRRSGLDPLARQIYCQFRFANVQDRKTGRWAEKRTMSIQTAIDGFRLIAERSDNYAGQLGPYWCGQDGEWRDVWLEPQPPAAARIGVLRREFSQPLWAVANWSSYVQLNRAGQPNAAWTKMGPIMIAKCAEALALRRAFPQELSGLYTNDEIPDDMMVDDAARTAPVAQPDAMTSGQTAAEQLVDGAAPPPASMTPEIMTTRSIAEIQALENQARALADQGGAAFAGFWHSLDDAGRMIVQNLAKELRRRIDAADASGEVSSR